MKEDTPALDMEAIKKRCEAATPGPWGTQDCSSGGRILLKHPDAPLEVRPIQSQVQIVPAEDADFIAHARDDIPALVAEVEKWRGHEHDFQRRSEQCQELCEKLTAAEAEVKRLREALAKVRDMDTWSAEARTARMPAKPEALVGALQDTVHREVGRGRAARTVRVKSKR